MKVKVALLAKENQQDGLTTFSKAYFLWINFNASALSLIKLLTITIRTIEYYYLLKYILYLGELFDCEGWFKPFGRQPFRIKPKLIHPGIKGSGNIRIPAVAYH